jgi:hypothetical protein
MPDQQKSDRDAAEDLRQQIQQRAAAQPDAILPDRERLDALGRPDQFIPDKDREVLSDMRRCFVQISDSIWTLLRPVFVDLHGNGMRLPPEAVGNDWLPARGLYPSLLSVLADA